MSATVFLFTFVSIAVKKTSVFLRQDIYLYGHGSQYFDLNKLNQKSNNQQNVRLTK